MTKCRVSVEFEDGATYYFDFDSVTVNMKQEVWGGWEKDDEGCKDMSPDGTLELSIKGTRNANQKRLLDLKEKYPICRRIRHD